MSEIVSLLEKDDGIFLGSLSPRLVKAYCEQIGFITDVKHNISRSAFAGVMDAVRNSILDWSLKLEEAGVHGEGISFSKAETEKARAVTINIGNIGNAVGFGSFGDNATVTAKQTL